MHARKSWSEWAGIIEAFERSGESHAEFCAARRLAVGTFRSWLYKTRRDGGAGSATDIVLLPVSVKTPPAPTTPGAVVVAVAGVEVSVPIGADVAYVARFISELRSRC